MPAATLASEPPGTPATAGGWQRELAEAGLKGIPAGVLNPRDAWADPQAYDETARKLARMFRENFRRFEDGVDPAVTASMPDPDAAPQA